MQIPEQYFIYISIFIGAIYLAIALAIIPIIIAYVFLSRFIIAGVALGGVKE